jgi:tetratricopeptide (TPR) repeat protein/pimeloyl-ACP methyl ester carboxylesterase
VSPQSSAATDNEEPASDFRADVSRIIEYAPAELIGREDDLRRPVGLEGPVTIDSEGLHEIANTGKPDRLADVVFVHGLGGSSHKTWRYGNAGNDDHFFWPEELGKDLPLCGIWSIGYPAGFTGLEKLGMIIEQRAGNVAFKLAKTGLGSRPIVFVTHSIGGLVVKSLIVDSQTLPDQDRKKIVRAVRGIVFCGTPHRSSAMADAAGKLGIYFSGAAAYLAGFLGWTLGGFIGRFTSTRPQVKEMEANTKPLDFLHEKFVEWQSNYQIAVDTYAETQPLSRVLFLMRTLDCGVVVPHASANSGIAKCVVHDVDDHHLSLVRPRDRKHDVYVGVLSFIERALAPKPRTVTLTVTLPDNFGSFTNEKLDDLVELIVQQAKSSPASIAFSDKRRGSTKIEFQVTEDVANKILEKFATGQGALRDRGIVKVQVEMPRIQGAKSISLRRLGTATWAFVGREQELSQLNQIAELGKTRVATIVAAGGIGKTTLVAQWMSLLAAREWPGFEAVFDWSFYSQGTREQAAPSSDLFLAEALTFFGDPVMASSAYPPFDKGRRLAQLIEDRRALLVLDGLEPLQYAPTSPFGSEIKDQGIAALLKSLATASHGLCVVTTRYEIPDLRAYQQVTVSEIQLQRLSQESGVALLRSLGVQGKDDEFVKLVQDMKGHALSLKLIGSYLHYSHGGDIRRRDRVKLEAADAKEQGGHAFRVMEAYAQSLNSEGANGRRALALLSLLGFFDRPATADCLAALLQSPAIPGVTDTLTELLEPERNRILEQLESARLISVHRDGTGTLLTLDAHPLLREYFEWHLHAENPEAWRSAHRRLYEYLVASTADKEQPTLEDLQPLYQAIVHGCQAGLQAEALRTYQIRIARRDENYSAFKLGAIASDLGALACFFDTPWTQVSSVLTEPERAWLLSNAAYYLRALGRLIEALEPMRAGLENYAEGVGWKSAAQAASNLSELELTLGRIAAAEADAARSVVYADRSGDSFMRMAMRTTHADVLHQTDRRSEAAERFREAEQMQKERQPAYPLLYSVQGFRYCDLLLAPPERDAWRHMLSLDPQLSLLDLSNTCGAVLQRAALALKWDEEENWILDAALDHLALGRASFYAAILEDSDSAMFEAMSNARLEVDAAVHGLRRAGTRHMIPHALLTRAWLRFVTGARAGPESTQEDLDEAWEIAERAPMKLFMSDIHLYRARLFFREEKYPWESPVADLTAARKLIETSGYWRRKEELEDAEKQFHEHT